MSASSRPVRRHVGDGVAVAGRQVADSRAEELDEFFNHAALAQHFSDGEHQVGGGGTFGELAGEAHADHVGHQHR